MTHAEWKRALRRLLILTVMLAALLVIQSSSFTRVAYASCMNDCSNSCGAELSACQEFCAGCPQDGYYPNFAGSGYPPGAVTCNEECYNNCQYGYYYCAINCYDLCGGN